MAAASGARPACSALAALVAAWWFVVAVSRAFFASLSVFTAVVTRTFAFSAVVFASASAAFDLLNSPSATAAASTMSWCDCILAVSISNAALSLVRRSDNCAVNWISACQYVNDAFAASRTPAASFALAVSAASFSSAGLIRLVFPLSPWLAVPCS